MKVIDLNTWSRRSHFEFFRSQQNPHINVASSLDVTNFLTHAKAIQTSLFNAFLFGIMRAANDIPEFRMRFRGDKVVEHEVVHASTTVPIDDERFAFCGIEFTFNWPEFNTRCLTAVQEAKRQSMLQEHIVDSDEWIFSSCLPWMNFSAFVNPNNGPDDCIPRISWGKFTQHGSHWIVSVSVQVHHALVDGIHLGNFFELLTDYMTNWNGGEEP